MYYKKTKGLYDPTSPEPYKLSRSKIELFINCPRCFYMEARLGLGRPSTPPFTLNNAVDNLLKNEFDLLRKDSQSHELMKKYEIDAIPFKDENLKQWRGEVTAYEGALVVDENSNLLINGLVDDIWQNSAGELNVVDYKATSTEKEISLDDEYKQAYKRQMEIYQWIFRKLGYKVSNTGYFVFANAQKNLPKFDGKLEFEMSIVSHTGNDSWVPLTLLEIKKTLDREDIPEPSYDCDYCDYRRKSAEASAYIKSKLKK